MSYKEDLSALNFEFASYCDEISKRDRESIKNVHVDDTIIDAFKAKKRNEKARIDGIFSDIMNIYA